MKGSGAAAGGAAGLTVGPAQAPRRHALHVSLARIRAAESGRVYGAGFLVGERLLCTCAHVVAEALGRSALDEAPGGKVVVDFPFLGEERCAGEVSVWRPIGGSQPQDVALLTLAGAVPAEARPARLLAPRVLAGHEFRVCGFPEGSDTGVWARGVLDERRADGTVQIERDGPAGFRVQPGFSGTPVWDARERGVVGMVVSSWRERDVGAAFMTPVEVLVKVAEGRFQPAARGAGPWSVLTGGVTGSLKGLEDFLALYTGTPGRPAPPFGGRQRELAALDRWLADPYHPYLLLVADAGRGKSSLLAHWALEVAESQRAAVAFVPISIRFDTNLRQRTLGLLLERVQFLVGDEDVRSVNPDVWQAELQRLLCEERDPEPPLLVVLDGADEAAAWRPERDLPLPSYAVQGLKVVLSARRLVDRDAQGWLRALGWQGLAETVELAPLDREGIAEVVAARAGRSAADVPSSLIDQLARLTEGDPLLVSLYAEAIGVGGFIAAERLIELAEGGLRDYFDEWWRSQKERWRSENRDPLRESDETDQLLATLATALGPLPRDDLAALAEIHSGRRLDDKLTELNRWVVASASAGSPAEGYVFAHPRLADYFRAGLLPSERREMGDRFRRFCKAQLDELNAGAVPDCVSSYAVRHYSAHLLSSDVADRDALHALITPAWARAWEALEHGYEGFLQDVARAWQHADQTAASERATAHARAEAFALQMRYALVTASIHSLATNIEPALLAMLVETDPVRWPPLWAINQTRRIVSEEQRAQALEALSRSLPGEVLAEALHIAREISDEDWRSQALIALAEGLPEALVGIALDAVREIGDEEGRSLALMSLANGLPEASVGAFLDAVREIDDEVSRAMALAGLGEGLPEACVDAVLDAVREIRDEPSRAMALQALAEAVSEEHRAALLAEALDTAREISEEPLRSWTTMMFAEGLPEEDRVELLAEALDTGRAIGDEPLRFSALMALAGSLPAEDRTGFLAEALDAARAITDGQSRCQALAELAARLPDHERFGLMGEALDAARDIGDEPSRSHNLTRLAAGLPEAGLPKALVCAFLDAAREISDEAFRSWALAALAEGLPEASLGTLLDAVREISDEPLRSHALARLGKALSEASVGAVLDAAREIADEQWRWPAVAALAEALPEDDGARLLAETLHAARAIADEQSRSRVLMALGERLPQDDRAGVLAEALDAARAIGDEPWRSRALTALAEGLPEQDRAGLLAEALDAACSTGDEMGRSLALAALAERLPEALVGAAFDAAREITDEEWRSLALDALLDRLPEELLGTAVNAARAIADGQSRSPLLRALAERLPAEDRPRLLAEALEAARTISDAHIRSISLTALAERVPEDDRVRLLAEALDAARAIDDEQWRSQALAELAEQVPEDDRAGLLAEALDAARAVDDEESRSQALAQLAGRLPETLAGSAFEAASAICDEESRTRALVAFTQRMPDEDRAELLAQALDTAPANSDEQWQWDALMALAELGYADDRAELLAHAVDTARAMSDEESRALALAAIAERLPQADCAELMAQALDAARPINEYFLETALSPFAAPLAALPTDDKLSLWGSILHGYALTTRSQLLAAIASLAPGIPAMVAPARLAHVIREVSEWWP